MSVRIVISISTGIYIMIHHTLHPLKQSGGAAQSDETRFYAGVQKKVWRNMRALLRRERKQLTGKGYFVRNPDSHLILTS